MDQLIPPSYAFPLLYSLIHNRTLAVASKVYDLGPKQLPSSLQVEELFCYIGPSPFFYGAKAAWVTLQMLELMSGARLDNGEWSSQVLEKLLLLEYEFIDAEHSRLLGKTLTRRWSQEFTSVFQKDQDLRKTMEEARKLPLAYSMIPSILESLILYRKNREMMDTHGKCGSS